MSHEKMSHEKIESIILRTIENDNKIKSVRALQKKLRGDCEYRTNGYSEPQLNRFVHEIYQRKTGRMDKPRNKIDEIRKHINNEDIFKQLELAAQYIDFPLTKKFLKTGGNVSVSIIRTEPMQGERLGCIMREIVYKGKMDCVIFTGPDAVMIVSNDEQTHNNLEQKLNVMSDHY